MKQQSYEVAWLIDVEADSFEDAAKQALDIFLHQKEPQFLISDTANETISVNFFFRDQDETTH